MGLLDGSLRQMFGAAFGTVLLNGSHFARTETVATNGDVTSVLATVAQPVKGYREQTTDRMRELGYTDSEARLLILQTYGGAIVTAPNRDDVIDLDGVRWICGDIGEDAAHTHWTIRATRE